MANLKPRLLVPRLSLLGRRWRRCNNRHVWMSSSNMTVLKLFPLSRRRWIILQRRGHLRTHASNVSVVKMRGRARVTGLRRLAMMEVAGKRGTNAHTSQRCVSMHLLLNNNRSRSG